MYNSPLPPSPLTRFSLPLLPSFPLLLIPFLPSFLPFLPPSLLPPSLPLPLTSFSFPPSLLPSSLLPFLPPFLQNLFCPDMLFTFDSLKDDLQTKIRHSMSPATQASPPPDDPPVLSTSSAPSSLSPPQVSPIHLSVSEEDLERVLLLWNEECQEARWLLDLMELLNKLVPLRCAAVNDIERCKRGMQFCASMTAVEEQLSLHAVSIHTQHGTEIAES